MATESFFEDMVIDTSEAADNLTALFESGVRWKRGDTKIVHLTADDLRRIIAEQKGEGGGQSEQTDHTSDTAASEGGDGSESLRVAVSIDKLPATTKTIEIAITVSKQ